MIAQYQLHAFTCLVVFAMSAGACDTYGVVTSSEREAPAKTDAQSRALVSKTPEKIDGLSPVGFDRERQVYVYDRDGDEFPDLSEALAGTDMFDPNNNPGEDQLSEAAKAGAGFPTGTCRAGFRLAGPRLCISEYLQNATKYPYAANNCRIQGSNVCSYEDLTYLYLNSPLDATYDPYGRWIGNITGDDQVLFGNASITYDGDPDWINFENTSNKQDTRSYWCCHDAE